MPPKTGEGAKGAKGKAAGGATRGSTSGSGAASTSGGPPKRKSMKKVVRKSLAVSRLSKAGMDDQFEKLREAEAMLHRMNAPKPEAEAVPDPQPAPPVLDDDDDMPADLSPPPPPPPPPQGLDADDDLDEIETELAAAAEEGGADEEAEEVVETTGTVTVECDTFTRDFDIVDGRLGWDDLDAKFGITSGDFNGMTYGEDFERPIYDAEGNEMDLGFSRENYYGFVAGRTYSLQLPPGEPKKVVPAGPVKGKVRLRYNHYNDEFEIEDGRLRWGDVDDTFCISFAFKGNYHKQVYLHDFPGGEEMRAGAGGDVFYGLKDGEQYVLKLTEDALLAARPSVGYKAPSDPGLAALRGQAPCPMVTNTRVGGITDQLKGLSTDDLRNNTDEYKQLKEARDLEDLLFS